MSIARSCYDNFWSALASSSQARVVGFTGQISHLVNSGASVGPYISGIPGCERFLRDRDSGGFLAGEPIRSAIEHGKMCLIDAVYLEFRLLPRSSGRQF